MRRSPRHRGELQLQLHCYRLLGSFTDAGDHVQETFLRALRRRSGAGVDLGPADLPAHRLGRADAELLGHRAHRLALGGVIRAAFGDQAHRSLRNAGCY
jgi:hypothetical protein